MIQKTASEKEALKAAKALYNQAVRLDKVKRIKMSTAVKNPGTFIRTGILPSEKVLENNYPVYWDRLYVIDGDELNNGRVVRSDVQGTIATLKRDLKIQGFTFSNIYNCDISARRVTFE